MSIRSTRTKLSFLPVLLLAGASAFAQSPLQPGQQTLPTSQIADQARAPAHNPTELSPSTEHADQTFVADILKNNDTQIQLSQLAQQRASSGDVKDFSQKMIDIHTQFNQQLAPLAKKLDVNQNQKPSKQQQKEIAALEQLSGSDFDTAYLQAMAREQSQSLKEFRSHKDSQNPNIQKTAQMDEPILAQHYQILQKIAESHNITLASND